MKKLNAILLAGTMLATPAAATDLLSIKDESGHPFQWTGLYVGVHGGYADGDWEGTLKFDSGSGPEPIWGESANRTIDGDGWLAGGQIGYLRQHGRFVYGLEVDGAWTDFEGSDTFRTVKANGDPGDVTWSIKQQLDWYGTARARFGLAFDQVLFYGTGGIAFGEAEADLVVRHHEPDPKVTARGGAEETHVGWAAGVGIEWAPKDRLRLGIQWLHIDLGEEDYRLVGTNYNTKPPSPHTTDSFPSDLKFDVIQVRANYRLN